jgi:hypothetical protein
MLTNNHSVPLCLAITQFHPDPKAQPHIKMKQVSQKTIGVLGLILTAATAQAGFIESSDGMVFEGGAWGSREAAVGWTVTGSGAEMRGITNTVAFGSTDSTTLELGNFSAGGTRLGRDFLRYAGASLDTNGTELDESYSWFTDGDTIDYSGGSATSVDFTSGLIDGSNWFIITLDNAPTNYTGYTPELGGVTEAAIELIWDDVDSSGTRTIGDTYDIGRIFYATGTDTFEGNGWVGGAPTTTSTIPEPSSYALLAGLSGLAFIALRRR